MKLVLVESPTKARTLSRYLGGEFDVQATYGHVRDLPEKKMGITIELESGRAGEYKFIPEYVSTPGQKEKIDAVRGAADSAEVIYLATDPDREGEAIAYHAGELLKVGKGKKSQTAKFKRIVFHEITKTAIDEAMGHARDIDLQLVHAQQARRVVDRLVGYKLSPLLWKKVRRGLSAGRVQSVAVRLVVEREKEIEAFVPVEYWDLGARLKTVKDEVVEVKLIEKNGEKIKIEKGDEAEGVVADLQVAKYAAVGIEKKEFSRTPPAPFITSTMQQAAANRMGWSAKKTMQVAQNLYEEGYITYHRTDSTNIAAEAMYAAKIAISKIFGSKFALMQPRIFKTKSKVAQEAHEAIRPTAIDMAELPGGGINRDQSRLYEMIWKRFVACQMEEVTGESVKVKVMASGVGNNYALEARGEIILFEGWYKALGRDSEENRLPEIAEGEKLDLVEVLSEQKFTQPPARYSDAGLIKTLEEMGIGRPSTYAPIISTIQERNYVERVEKRFQPTSLGVAVNDFLVANFAGIVDYQFTAKMEDNLDEIANGGREWQKTVGEFWGPFEKLLASVGESAQRVHIQAEETGDKCPECAEGSVVVRIGKFGKFLACNRYPECKFKANFQDKIGMKCTKCGDGDVIMRRTKFKKSFYGCSNYPKCDFASWTKPVVKSETEEKIAEPTAVVE